MQFLKGCVLALSLSIAVHASTIYIDRSAFEAALESTLTDSYSPADGYPAGFGVYSDATMSGFFGETHYQSTGFLENNVVTDESYCAGCNGSFLLEFTSTSIGMPDGVHGVGLDIAVHSGAPQYHAYITFGDNSTLNHALPIGPSFFGIIDPLLIRSVHFGLGMGDTTLEGQLRIDNLTIGATGATESEIPEPASLVLLGPVLAGLALRRRRQ